ncbi:single-stranded-DNA-specific exonuclease RecJ [Ligilactobacillus aviarius]|uniref:single-stranded-DNA-specific exonuclease RecJ n=1 Tax=Ligilactobacillus aviarius TaxID=1606 RepID=UPI00195E76E0|nr:single-stranded-DNA-specific exonuclease RecJ [Ligilactobacillus aviarius]MBM6862668.1 single-stranded-DNA-specific exonuclease RecJ [Ligilactobacillus aviarius]
MITSNYDWKMAVSKLDDQQINELAQTLHHSPLLIKILAQRGMENANQIKDFLEPQGQYVHDPYLLYDMEKAIDRIQQAIIENQKIFIYGDYDADGITSTAVMYETLLQLGADVQYFVPDRFKDGYGPNLAEYQNLEAQGMQLLITVDNGVSGYDEVQYLMDKGIDVIITDHHELPEKLPPAYAIVHPMHPKGNYPFKGLAGVGVAFKVACALLDDIPQEELDLVAIGTVADVMSLTDENRDLVSFGIEELKTTMRPGLSALLEVTKTKPDEIDSDTIGFTIAPRLNSLGRLENAAQGVKLLTTLNENEATQLAQHTHDLNQQRQDLVATITKEAEQILSQTEQPHLVNVIAGQNWHEGVLGIVASRITEETKRPTIVLTLTEDNLYKGSGRSVEGFNLFDAFDPHRKLFESFGGHAQACGLSIKPDNLAGFQVIADQEAENQHFNGNERPVLEINEELPAASISLDLINELNLLAPFGCDNPRPVFKITGIQNPQLKVMGDQGQHFRINFQNGHGSLAGVKFNASPAEVHQLQAASLNRVEIAGELTVNRWQGRTTPQIQICDLRTEAENEISSKIKVIDHRFTSSPNKFNSEFVYGFFNLKLLKRVAAQVASNIKLISLTDQEPIVGNTLVIVDCPPSISAFESLVDRLQVKQIVLKCYTQHNIASKPLPSRQDFGKLYRFTSTHHDVDLRKDLEKLANYLNFDKESLVFMIQVFSEAKFVKIKNGLLTGTPSNQRIELTKTKRYQARVAEIQAQQLFLNSKTADLLKRLNLTI